MAGMPGLLNFAGILRVRVLGGGPTGACEKQGRLYFRLLPTGQQPRHATLKIGPQLLLLRAIGVTKFRIPAGKAVLPRAVAFAQQQRTHGNRIGAVQPQQGPIQKKRNTLAEMQIGLGLQLAFGGIHP